MWKKCGGRRAFSVLVQNLNSTDVLAVAYVIVLLDSLWREARPTSLNATTTANYVASIRRSLTNRSTGVLKPLVRYQISFNYVETNRST